MGQGVRAARILLAIIFAKEFDKGDNNPHNKPMIKLTLQFNDEAKTKIAASGHSLGLCIRNVVNKLVGAQENVFDDSEVLYGISEVIRTEQPYSFTHPESPESNFTVTMTGKVDVVDVPSVVVPENPALPSGEVSAPVVSAETTNPPTLEASSLVSADNLVVA